MSDKPTTPALDAIIGCAFIAFFAAVFSLIIASCVTKGYVEDTKKTENYLKEGYHYVPAKEGYWTKQPEQIEQPTP